MATDYQQDNESIGPGRAGLKALFTRLRTAFPDLAVSIQELISEGETVVAVTVLRGTQERDLPGIGPTGRGVDVSSIDVYSLRDGRITEHFGRFDELEVLEQLGVAHDLSWPGSRA